MMEITQQFGFDAAHFLDAAPGEANRRMHGHSFYVEVTLRGETDPTQGWLRDFEEVEGVLKGIREEFDHRLLNEVKGLGPPTLENIARHIFRRAKPKLPELCQVKVSRPSYGQSCTYQEG